MLIGDEITENILKKVRANYAQEMSDDEKPIVLVDTSLWTKGKRGLLCTDRAVYWRTSGKTTYKRCYEEIASIAFGPQPTLSEDGIAYIDGNPVEVSFLDGPWLTSLLSCLQHANGLTPEMPLEEIPRTLDGILSPKTKALGMACFVGLVVFILAVLAVPLLVVVNPRLLVPIAIALACCLHCGFKGWHPIIVLLSIVALIIFVIGTLPWLMAGF